MNIQNIIKSANEIATLKRSLGTDASPWEMSDCLATACKGVASLRGTDNMMLVRPHHGEQYWYPVSHDSQAWGQGWI